MEKKKKEKEKKKQAGFKMSQFFGTPAFPLGFFKLYTQRERGRESEGREREREPTDF